MNTHNEFSDKFLYKIDNLFRKHNANKIEDYSMGYKDALIEIYKDYEIHLNKRYLNECSDELIEKSSVKKVKGTVRRCSFEMGAKWAREVILGGNDD
jgi:hypothetical protein